MGSEESDSLEKRSGIKGRKVVFNASSVFKSQSPGESRSDPGRGKGTLDYCS